MSSKEAKNARKHFLEKSKKDLALRRSPLYLLRMSSTYQITVQMSSTRRIFTLEPQAKNIFEALEKALAEMKEAWPYFQQQIDFSFIEAKKVVA
jgi:hypothetical protein